MVNKWGRDQTPHQAGGFRDLPQHGATRRAQFVLVQAFPHPSPWSLVAPQAWSLVARLAVIPWSQVAHSNNKAK
jgi:hypothetical protein